MKVLFVLLIIVLPLSSAFGQFLKEDRKWFSKCLTDIMQKDSVQREKYYDLMSKAYPSDDRQKTIARFSDLADNRIVLDYFLLEMMKDLDFDEDKILRCFLDICKENQLAGDLQYYMIRKYNSEIYDLHMDTVRYYETQNSDPHKISLFLRSNSTVIIKNIPVVNPVDSISIIGDWETDSSLLRFYFSSKDERFVNLLFNKDIRGDNPFKMVADKRMVVVTTNLDDSDFKLMNTACNAKLLVSNLNKPAGKKDYSIVRAYKTALDNDELLSITMRDDDTVDLHFKSPVKEGCNILLVGNWTVDSLIRLTFSEAGKSWLNKIFTKDRRVKAPYRFIRGKKLPEVTIDVKSKELNLVDNRYKVILETDKLNSFMPAVYRGGLTGWQDFIQRNLDGRVPVRKGAKPGMYRVNVLFDIDDVGVISNIRAINDPGYGCVEEAIRVIALSPGWLPARKNGDRVKSTQKQIVNFKVEEPAGR